MVIYDADGKARLEEMGRIDGHAAGTKDGLEGKPSRPQPALTPALSCAEYVDGFVEGYAHGHAHGRDMRGTLLGWRVDTEEVERLAQRPSGATDRPIDRGDGAEDRDER